MIFVTTGTDHHPFDRLIKAVDNLKKENVIEDELFIQTGSSSYSPEYCLFQNFLSFDDFMKRVKESRMIISHGGPGSIMPVLYAGKMPIVMPRLKKFKEAVDNHQRDFVRRFSSMKMILLAENPQMLKETVLNYDNLIKESSSSYDLKNHEERLLEFEEKLDELCQIVLKKGKK